MNIFFCLLRLINFLIPKSNHKIIFMSRPDFSDNTKHMYSYMQKKVSDKQLSWLIYDKEIYTILIHNKHENIFYLKSLKGVWEYLRSKTIITSSSSLWQIKSPLQNQFDLWHGIPLKNILCMGDDIQKPQASNMSMRFATSSLNKAQLAASFNYSASKINITGQARTDALYSAQKHLSALIDVSLSDYNKVVCYMPTYRNGYKDKQDGNSFNTSNIFRLENYDHQHFLEYLKENNILFLLKLHPYEEKQFKNIDLGNNIKWITNKTLVANNLDIYNLLPEVDILLTDYSSVFFDFLLLDRKIIFIPSDLEAYTEKRGFQLEPYDFWTPGEKVFDVKSLQKALLSDDKKEEKIQRKTIRDIIFTYQDDRASERIYMTIAKYIGS